MQPIPPGVPARLTAFLLNDCLYSAQVATRCVLDLADEGVLLAEPGPGGALTISLAAAPPSPGRTPQPFEEVTLDRIRRRTAQRPDVPLSALISDDGDDHREWRERLTDALGREGNPAGLTTQAASKDMWYVWLGLTVAVGLITLIAYQFSVKAGKYVLGFGGLAVLAVLVTMFSKGGWRATREGAAVVALRRQPGKPLPWRPADPRVHTAALDPWAPAPGLGPGSAPLPRTQAWSSFGGHWHKVSVGQPAGPPSRAEVRRLSLPDRATVTGEVVKRWTDNTGPGDGAASNLVCIDDGSSRKGTTFDVAETLYKRLSTGDVAQVTYDPRRMHVLDIQKVAAESPGFTA